MTNRNSTGTEPVSPREFAELRQAAIDKFEKERRERETKIHGPAAPDLTANDARRSTAIMLGSRIAVAAMGWTGSVLIARSISPDEFGKFSLIFGLLGLLSVVTDLGVGRVVLAKLVECNRGKFRWSPPRSYPYGSPLVFSDTSSRWVMSGFSATPQKWSKQRRSLVWSLSLPLPAMHFPSCTRAACA